MKYLIFIGITILMASCSMQRIDFSKRVQAFSDETFRPKFSPGDYQEATTELSVVKPVEQPVDSIFETAHIEPVEIVESEESTDTLKKIAPMYEDPDPIHHNECKCFGKILRFTGATVAVIGIFSWFFGGATLGTGILLLGALMLLIGLIMKYVP